MKKLVIAVNLMMFLVLGLRAQNTPNPVKDDNPNAPSIKFDKEEHDYGTIQKGADGNCVFTFTNTGKEPLSLSDVKASCGCTIPTWPRDPILGGKSEKIQVHYDTQRVGDFTKSITVVSNAKNSPIVLRIKGKILDAPKEMTPDKPANNAAPINK